MVVSLGYLARGSKFNSHWYPIFDSCCYRICAQKQWGRQALWSWLRTPTLVVRVQLPLGWHTYLLFKSDVKNFVWKTDEGRQEALFC